MSRSKRKTPIYGISTSESDDWWKRKANRKHRHRVKEALATGEEIPLVRETSDVYGSPKDGKQYRTLKDYEFFEDAEERFDKEMRK